MLGLGLYTRPHHLAVQTGTSSAKIDKGGRLLIGKHASKVQRNVVGYRPVLFFSQPVGADARTVEHGIVVPESLVALGER